MTKIFIIAGEESGDLIGGDLLRQIKQAYPNSTITGVGGTRMQEQGGFQSLFPMSDLSVMGVAEIVAHLPRLLHRISQTKQAIAAFQPDLLLTIDAPDFGLRIAKWVKWHLPHVKTIHTVAPTVWAWRPGRAKKIARYLDGLMCLFPFEPPYFTAHGLAATFIGHPLVQMVQPLTPAAKMDFLARYNLSADKPILCLLPGSRVREINELLPVFLQTAQCLKQSDPDLQIILPTLPRLVSLIDRFVHQHDLDVRVITAQVDKYTAMEVSTLALHASGTVALELALCGTPMITAYQVSPLSAWLARRLLKIQSVNLVNILAGQPIVPEYLQENCTVGSILPTVQNLLHDPAKRQTQIAALQQVKQKLQAQAPAIDFLKHYL